MACSNIYNLKLHETIEVNLGIAYGYVIIIRVPGGWIYKMHSSGSCFVPYASPHEFEDIQEVLCQSQLQKH